jgi:hypothetical protein
VSGDDPGERIFVAGARPLDQLAFCDGCAGGQKPSL